VSCCDNQTETICPCATFIHPRLIFNPPALDAISYRVGDYTTFRHALLQARPGEAELTRTDGTRIEQIWRPGGSGDLAVQLMEWWAYLADILTFYNERVAIQAYLRTADLPESVNRLIRLLGYRPRPGIGAIGVLAALANGPKAFTLPLGFQIQSKPGPGQQPQVFELTADTKVGALVTGSPTAPQGEIDANPTTDPAQTKLPTDHKDPNYNSVLLQGTLSALKKGDRALLLGTNAPPPYDQFAAATVINVSYSKDPQLGAITRIQFRSNDDLSKVDDVNNFRLLKSDQTVQVWQYPADDGKVIRLAGDQVNYQVDLEAIARGINIDDIVLFEIPNSSPPVVVLVTVASSTEVVWYANPAKFDPTAMPPYTGVDPSVPPPDPKTTVPIPIPHTSLALTPQISDLSGNNDTPSTRATILIRYGWKDIGKLVAASPASVGGNPGGSEAGSGNPGETVSLLPTSGASFPSVSKDTQVLVEDAIGNGDTGILDTAGNLILDDPVPTLVPPLSVLFNLLSVTRGKSVANEVLGNGNAAVAGQDFVLQNAPVTYLQSPASVSGDDYSSTVRVWVNGLEWTEVRSFYGQPKDAQVFVTKEDEQGKTHVLFGDGENGARLPTGVNNVTANYRYGSGAQAPDGGSLTVVLNPQPGLKAIRNPVQVGGGSNPDAPAKVRQLAPRSVLTFNRAISVDDYQTIAAQAPGVTRAKAAFVFDATEQRPGVKIWVGDDAKAVDAARSAIAGAADPNRLPGIELATQIVINLSLTLVLDPRRNSTTVLNAVHDALLDPDNGVMGVNVVGIGQAFYDSQIYAACLAVAGVQAVHDINFSSIMFPIQSVAFGNIVKFNPLEKFAVSLSAKTALQFPLQQQAGSGAQRLTINRFIPRPRFAWSGCQCEHRHDPGDGGYFFLPDDGQHLTLSSTVTQ
jgi:hypothetical protein